MAHGLRAGIIGGGWPGLAHAAGFTSAGGWTVPVVADLIPERREALAHAAGHARQAASADEILGDPTVDLVSLCVPTDLHLPLALAAFKNGKHVLCEYPPAGSLRDAKQMQKAAQRAGRVLAYAAQRRFGGAELAARQAIAKGYAGEIYHLRLAWLRTRGTPQGTGWYADPARSGGGALIDLGTHLLDLAWHLLGTTARVASVYAVAHRRLTDIAPADNRPARNGGDIARPSDPRHTDPGHRDARYNDSRHRDARHADLRHAHPRHADAQRTDARQRPASIGPTDSNGQNAGAPGAHTSRAAAASSDDDHSARGVEESAFALLRFDNGASVELSCAWALNLPPQQQGTSCRAHGTLGSVDVYTPQGPVLHRHFDAQGRSRPTALKQPKVTGHAALMRRLREQLLASHTPPHHALPNRGLHSIAAPNQRPTDRTPPGNPPPNHAPPGHAPPNHAPPGHTRGAAAESPAPPHAPDNALPDAAQGVALMAVVDAMYRSIATGKSVEIRS